MRRSLTVYLDHFNASTAAIARADEPVRIAARTAPAPQQRAAREWAPYPEDYVERVEIAAKLLRATYEKRQLIDDLRRHPELLERFQLGLSECLLMLKAIGGRMTDG